MAGGGSQKSSQSSVDKGTNVWGPQQGYLKDLWGQAQGQNNAGLGQYGQQADQFINTAQSTMERMQNPGVDPAMAAYSQNIGDQYRQQFMPALQGQAIQAGGLRGSRQQIGAALGAGQAMDSISDFAANSYAGQQQRALQAAQSAPGLADFARSMPWYNLSQYAGILGSPVMQDLGGSSKGSSSGWNASVLGG